MLYNERTTGSPPRRGRSGDSRAALSLNLTLYAQSRLLYSTPWAVFPAAAVLGTALHYAARVHMVLFVVLATVTFAGAFWWFNRWALESWEETKRERGW